MKRLFMLTLLGLSLATGPVWSAADASPDKAVSEGQVIKVTAKTKTLAEKGRFHVVHDKKEKLECDDCHGGGADDILFLRTGEFQGKEGPVDRKECIFCHEAPKKPAFYSVTK